MRNIGPVVKWASLTNLCVILISFFCSFTAIVCRLGQTQTPTLQPSSKPLQNSWECLQNTTAIHKESPHECQGVRNAHALLYLCLYSDSAFKLSRSHKLRSLQIGPKNPAKKQLPKNKNIFQAEWVQRKTKKENEDSEIMFKSVEERGSKCHTKTQNRSTYQNNLESGGTTSTEGEREQQDETEDTIRTGKKALLFMKR